MKILVLTAIALSLSACATSSVRVLEGENGVNTVISRDSSLDKAEGAALAEAKRHCREQGKRAVFVKTDKSKYSDSASENSRNHARNASRASRTLSSKAKSSSTTGKFLDTVGSLGSDLTGGSDSASELNYRFKCK